MIGGSGVEQGVLESRFLVGGETLGLGSFFGLTKGVKAALSVGFDVASQGCEGDVGLFDDGGRIGFIGICFDNPKFMPDVFLRMAVHPSFPLGLVEATFLESRT